ncbi:MAG TPA: FAD:protein FMN transferase [Nitrosomonas mobilis]|nr:FAD:protein FMN transferase [Nitrosomonas mobilis]
MKLCHYAFKAMGTPCSMQLYSRRFTVAEATSKLVIQDIKRLEAKYSRYLDNSYLSRINQVAASGGEIRVDPETASLLDYAAACYRESGGLFDITSGALHRAWNFKSGLIPTKNIIKTALKTVGWKKLRWENPSLIFPIAGMELDLGGVVKEYAVDRAVTICWEAGIRNGMINLGGDIRVIGPHANGRPWRVGISHPRRRDVVLQTLELYEGGLASSGDYERCITLNGVRYGHILNPKTGWPVRHIAAVSVLGELCVVAGSAATIGMLKEDQADKWLRKLGLPHLWVTVDGETGGSLMKNLNQTSL